jgi:pyruvate, water dikinase
MKGLLGFFSQADRCVLLSRSSGKHVEKFRHFRDFLVINRDALRQLAEMEMCYYSGQSFTLADIGYQYENLFENVLNLIRSLNALADNRFAVLSLKAGEINSCVTSILRPVISRVDLAPVVPLLELQPSDIGSAGSKAVHLATIGRQTDLLIPAGFVVTATGYDLFLKANRIDQMVLDELAGLSPGDPKLEEVSARLLQLIHAAQVPEKLVALLHAHYDAIEHLTCPGVHLAIRSSAVREDSDASFAGQYISVLNVAREGIVDAYKGVVASSFTPRAIAYRQMAGIDITETPMCVLCLAMVNPFVSGVLYTVDPLGGDAETMHISAVLGLGEKLVSGDSAADTYIFDRSTGNLISQELVAKKYPLEAVNEANEKSNASLRETQGAILSEKDINLIVKTGELLEGLFAGPQDVEWAIDELRKLFILQSRPLHVLPKPLKPIMEPGNAVPLMKTGVGASHGVAAGLVYIVSEQETLASVPDHVVLVTKTASPRYAEVMGKIIGLITEVGSPTCHLASVAREFGVPMAVNVKDATRLLAPGDMITLYAQTESAIYQGSIENERQTAKPVKRRILDSSVHQRMRAVLDFLSPLHLINPADPAYLPENCSSLHDIIRFAHEQAIHEMFNLSALAEERSVSVKLSSHIPLTLHLIDLGGGLASGLSTCDTVRAEHFISEPIKALWRGFTHPGINWSGTVQFDGKSFLSRMAASATSEFGPEPGGDSYALIGTDYLNFSARFGYHFATLDTFCSDEPDHNYLSLQFSGGAGTFLGKTLRLQFLGKILKELGCTVNLQGDLLEASLNRFPRSEMSDRLDHIGRLLASSRLLDMSISSQQDVDALAGEFLQGNYDLLNYKGPKPLRSFYTHLGNWQLAEEDGTTCFLSDGSPSMNSLSSNVSGLVTKTFGRSYQDLLDTIGAYFYFPLAVSKRGEVGNAAISLMVKPLRGSIDQAGGLVFGLRDIGNYFVFRINALEDNAILFEFIDNKRFERAQVKIPVVGETWHALQVTVKDTHAFCKVNGIFMFEYLNERPIHGHVGLWTKADSVTLFKDLLLGDKEPFVFKERH